ncbi:NADH-quinone oxidoreductase subunit A [Candidatus Bandiella euplotis]|uniref:NADH-quinone oxidoreductase subunit A n=1 Tax=Candidatus Bandiella euplotis TaxID=1664265 RepID=A0ABZ0ULC8_9RICK|nr:NADH-quinone oxidoreductase subunit A [Candidatus Bandiella woodruffii]WPX96926.1 NADH-quinone oxidoreductase subunit A [Candidatus Bandiella woodruffii]
MELQKYLENYLAVSVFIVLSLVLALLLVLLPFLVNNLKPDREKLSTYECGFENFGNTKGNFDVRFYLVSILFIIFDLEIAFMFPWAIKLRDISVFGFWSMIVFIITLGIGFIYEWKKGALEWE